MKIDYLKTLKKRTSKQIVGAGMTLAGGMIALPFINFKKASKYKANITNKNIILYN